MNEATNAAHLCGSTRRKARRTKVHSTKGDNKGRHGYVSYCPECPQTPASLSRPGEHPHTMVTLRQKRASARCGHTWNLV